MASEESGMELSGSTQFSESPEISLGEEEAVEQGTDGLEEDLAGMEEEAGNPDQDAGPNLAAYTRGAWKGSDVSQAEIDWLYRSRRIPEEVFCRIPGKEREPMPEPGEIVVFTAHFERGFGLPASDFFRRFLDFYELQPHHLPANAIFYLSSFVSFMEGFVGLLPTVETFARFYNLQINSIQDPQLPTPKPVVLDRFPCILAEVPESFEPKRLFLDDVDPDPYVAGNVHKMVPADESPQVLEHATPLAAEVGDRPAPRVRKTPASDADRSAEPAPKRQKTSGTGPSRKKRKNEIPTSSGPALELTRSAPGMRPEALQDTRQLQHPPQQSLAHSGAGKTHSSPRGGRTSSGSVAPKQRHHRAEDFTPPPETEDTDVGNMGAGSEPSGRSPSPAKGTTAPPPASASKPPPAPHQSSRKDTEVSAEQLSAAVTAAAAPASGSQDQTLVLHAGRAAITAGEKVPTQLGRIVELNRGDANLGELQRLVDRWNLADLTEATRGVGKDGKVVVDSRGPRSTVQHFGQLKQAVKEFDNAWHDANHNVLGVLDSRKQVFEELLWEHRDLTEAHSALQLTHSQCRAALLESSQLDELISQVAALQVEKEKLALQHQNEVQA
ncbi:hypothetical protein ACQ4PT_044409 [Festuca glaucescens]